ncbi:hypothetical protein IHN32_12200 [Deinococcus sp. 14RED07]|uniref:hypothetical protein n=1 Tax=Deinococcus sp. 14RED07 TaxID=2745874 RepID=UPI001E5E2153|nr:hypothetical protein [Deinococcus sp. 14RED07]MCD0176704.1 hypothetical protein [Deinococcus sp. 14RED07]
MTPTKTMYVLSLAPCGVPLAAALAQDSEQQCDALLLNIVGTNGTFTPYREWTQQVAAHREQPASQRRAVTP